MHDVFKNVLPTTRILANIEERRDESVRTAYAGKYYDNWYRSPVNSDTMYESQIQSPCILSATLGDNILFQLSQSYIESLKKENQIDRPVLVPIQFCWA